MKYLKCFFHSVYISYIGWFGGSVTDGTYYLLWTIHVNGNKNCTFKRVRFVYIKKIEPLFLLHNDSILK